jgi:hypothetical protein
MLDTDGTIRINQSIVPDTTLDSLYNNSGALFWNNKQISAGPDLYSISGSIPNDDNLSLKHDQGTNDILISAWVRDGTKWVKINNLGDSSDTSGDYYYSKPDNNTVRLYNKSGSLQSLKLDVFASGANVAEWYTPEDLNTNTEPSIDITVDTGSNPGSETTPSGSSSDTSIVVSATTPNTEIENGEIVAISGTLDEYGIPMIRKTNAYYDSGLFGVVTSKAKEEMGIQRDGRKLVALSGRVPVKIDPDSSDIKSGEYVTASTLKDTQLKLKCQEEPLVWHYSHGIKKITIVKRY